MPTTKPNVSRTVLIFLSKDGSFQFARRGTRRHSELIRLGYLPAASVPTLGEARKIQTATCKLAYDGSLWRYPVTPTLDGLEKAGIAIEVLFQHHKAGLPGWPDQWSAAQ